MLLLKHYSGKVVHPLQQCANTNTIREWCAWLADACVVLCVQVNSHTDCLHATAQPCQLLENMVLRILSRRSICGALLRVPAWCHAVSCRLHRSQSMLRSINPMRQVFTHSIIYSTHACAQLARMLNSIIFAFFLPFGFFNPLCSKFSPPAGHVDVLASIIVGSK